MVSKYSLLGAATMSEAASSLLNAVGGKRPGIPKTGRNYKPTKGYGGRPTYYRLTSSDTAKNGIIYPNARQQKRIRKLTGGNRTRHILTKSAF